MKMKNSESPKKITKKGLFDLRSKYSSQLVSEDKEISIEEEEEEKSKTTTKTPKRKNWVIQDSECSDGDEGDGSSDNIFLHEFRAGRNKKGKYDNSTVRKNDEWFIPYDCDDTIPSFPLPNHINLQHYDDGRFDRADFHINLPAHVKLLTSTKRSADVSRYIDINQPPLLPWQKLSHLDKFQFNQQVTKKVKPYDDSLILHNNIFRFKLINLGDNGKLIDAVLIDNHSSQWYLISDPTLFEGWVKVT